MTILFSGFRLTLTRLGVCVLLSWLAGCSQVAIVPDAPPASGGSGLFAPPNDPGDPAWQPVSIRFKTASVYSLSAVDGSPCIRAESSAAWSLLVAKVPAASHSASVLSWRWHVPALVLDADNTVPGKDDAAVRVVIAFKGDRTKLDAAERATMSLARVLGGNELPFAAIQYIWEAKAPLEAIVANVNTGRIKKLVVKSGSDDLNSWQSFTRDVRADFRRAFPGEEPGDIESIGLMTDTDSLGGKAEACYADVVLR